MSNYLSENFTPAYFTGDPPTEEEILKARDFQLEELTALDQKVKRAFSFDNEVQRNSDPSNVALAREGVKEVFEDAMGRLKVLSTRLRKEAHEEGYQAGYQEGFKGGEEAARKEFTPFLEALQGLVRDLTEFRKGMFPKVEREMVEMIVGLAKKVIQHELASREDAIQDVIRLAVQSVLDREKMVIKVHPADKTYAESYRPELHQMFSDIKNITFEAHPALERGGCIIETNFGRIDARVDNLHDQIEKLLQMAPPLPETPGTELEG